MSEHGCPLEPKVLEALRSEDISDELRVHAMECSDCTELVLVAGLLNRDAQRFEAIGPVPDAGYVWWRAHLKEREVLSRRATGVITLIQRISVVVAGLVGVFVLRGLLPFMESWASAFKSSAGQLSLPTSATSPALVILVCLGLLAAPRVFDLYGGWAGD